MREVTVKVYKFDELSNEAQDRILERERQFQGENGDVSDAIRWMLTDEIEQRGLPTGEIRFRISYSQGDGVAFYGDVDLGEFLSKNPDFRAAFPEVAKQNDKESVLDLRIKSSGSLYHHENTIEVEDYTEELHNPILEQEHESFVEAFQRHIRSVSAELASKAHDIDSHMNTNEYLKERLDPDAEYFVDGDRYEG